MYFIKTNSEWKNKAKIVPLTSYLKLSIPFYSLISLLHFMSSYKLGFMIIKSVLGLLHAFMESFVEMAAVKKTGRSPCTVGPLMAQALYLDARQTSATLCHSHLQNLDSMSLRPHNSRWCSRDHPSCKDPPCNMGSLSMGKKRTFEE